MKLYSYIRENILRETILVPRNIERRKEKLRQMNIELLSQEIIEGDLEIDESFEEIPLDLIKVKEIKGDVGLVIDNYIPLWLKDVKIYGDFICSFNNLKSLDNCPQYVGGSFWCTENELTSLEGCPKYIGKDLICYDNKEILELPKDVELKGSFEN